MILFVVRDEGERVYRKVFGDLERFEFPNILRRTYKSLMYSSVTKLMADRGE